MTQTDHDFLGASSTHPISHHAAASSSWESATLPSARREEARSQGEQVASSLTDGERWQISFIADGVPGRGFAADAMTNALLEADGAAFGRAFGNCSANLDAVLMAEGVELLSRRGMFESALLAALSTTRVNHHEIPLSTIHRALRSCDRSRLHAAGEPLPAELGDDITAYRGVAGEPRHRRIAGVSWTLDVAHARFFAERSAWLAGVAEGQVYSITVPRQSILAYLGEREHEVIIIADRRRVRLVETISVNRHHAS